MRKTGSLRRNIKKSMLLTGAVLMGGLAMTGCTSYESAYEEAVYDLEPLYCYRSLADVSCANTPYFRDERRLTNYFGPSPNRYDRPAPPTPARLDPPPATMEPFILPEIPADPLPPAPEPDDPSPSRTQPPDLPEAV